MQIVAYGGSQGAPFHGAIIESTALEATSTSNVTVDSFNSVAEMSGCVPNGTSPQSNATLTCMRSLSMETLLNTTITQLDATSSENDGDIYLPTVDGDFLPASGSELVRTGRFTKMPIMAGWTNNDATLFTSTSIKTANDTQNFFETYYPALTQTTLSEILSLYPVSDFAANPSANLSAEFYRSAQIFRDILLACPNFYLGHAMANKCTSITPASNASDQSAYREDASCPPVYLYVQNQTILTPYLEASGEPGLGVIHTSELPYVFGDFYLYNTSGSTVYPTQSDYELNARQSRAWSTFASVGQPSLTNKNTLQGWEPAFEPGFAENDTTGVIGAKLYVIGGPQAGLSQLEGKDVDGAVGAEQLYERCGFLNSAEVITQLQY
jgi:carboxylesterase type B